MTDDRQREDTSPAGDVTPDVPNVAAEDDSLHAASKEAVEFMEQSEGPGHAGRGDSG